MWRIKARRGGGENSIVLITGEYNFRIGGHNFLSQWDLSQLTNIHEWNALKEREQRTMMWECPNSLCFGVRPQSVITCDVRVRHK